MTTHIYRRASGGRLWHLTTDDTLAGRGEALCGYRPVYYWITDPIPPERFAALKYVKCFPCFKCESHRTTAAELLAEVDAEIERVRDGAEASAGLERLVAAIWGEAAPPASEGESP